MNFAIDGKKHAIWEKKIATEGSREGAVNLSRQDPPVLCSDKIPDPILPYLVVTLFLYSSKKNFFSKSIDKT
jgi:hypothetical protein